MMEIRIAGFVTETKIGCWLFFIYPVDIRGNRKDRSADYTFSFYDYEMSLKRMQSLLTGSGSNIKMVLK